MSIIKNITHAVAVRIAAALPGGETRRIERLIDKLTKKNQARQAADVAKWKAAVDAAESRTNPQRARLMLQYRQAMADSHLASLVNTRKQKVLGTPFRVVDANGVEDPVKTQLLKVLWFYRLLEYMLDSTFYGHSLIQVIPQPNGASPTVDLIPREHVIPEKGIVTIEQGQETGISYREFVGSGLIEVGDKESLGLLLQATVNQILKKNATIAWIEFCEVFGVPMRVVTTDATDNDKLNKIEDTLTRMGRMPWAILSRSEDLKYQETARNDAYKVYLEMVNLQNSEMSKVILGQTMVTDSGASRAQGEIHERLLKSITQSDLRLVEPIINEQLLPLFPEFAGCRFQFRRYEEMGMTERMALYKSAYEMGYRFSIEEMEAEFGFEIAAEQVQAEVLPQNALSA